MMTEINDLTQVDALSVGDQFPIWQGASGDTRRVSASAVTDFIKAQVLIVATDTVLSSPSATGFSVALSGVNNQRLILTPTAAFAAGTIVLPTGAVAGQWVRVSTSQAVTALTITGATSGAPTTLAANGYFTLEYDAAAAIWRRVG